MNSATSGNYEDDDDDDDMAELFSFSADTADETVAMSTPGIAAEHSAGSASGSNPPIRLSMQGMEGTFGTDNDRSGRDRATSTDSLLEMLSNEIGTASRKTPMATAQPPLDSATQEILEWLDEKPSVHASQSTTQSSAEPLPDSTWIAPVDGAVVANDDEPQATVVALPPNFQSFAEAIHSSEATVSQLRSLYKGESIESGDRPALYCRIILGKTVDETLHSSLADSFHAYTIPPDLDINKLFTSSSFIEPWSKRIAELTNRSIAECQIDLIKLLCFYQSQRVRSSGENDTALPSMDPLLPPIAATILATGIPVPAASVLLAQLIPQFIPLLALEPTERWETAKFLHQELYRLAYYHEPLLIYHLDRHLPGWYWPVPLDSITHTGPADTETSVTAKGRQIQNHGVVPPLWLFTLWADLTFSTENTLQMWDRIFLLPSALSSSITAPTLRFFLPIVLWQDATEELFAARTESELRHQLYRANTTAGTTHPPPEWWNRAQLLHQSTPESFLSLLQTMEDRAMHQAVLLRQERMEAAIQQRLQEEAAAYAIQQAQKEAEARERLTRARLVAFYREHCPDKEKNIDEIMVKYTGQYDELDRKLKAKYGVGFNPPLKKTMGETNESKPALSKSANKLLATMNQGLGRRREKVGEEEAMDKDSKSLIQLTDLVSVTVTPDEVLPVICWSAEARGGAQRHHVTRGRKPLKFYLVDSRSDEATHEQGYFATALNLSPETLLDPERLRQNEDMFESLRGAVHIVVMGEGFSALPKLYNPKLLSSNLDDLTREDDSRTNSCALFFVKKGFPFVSVLEGGFAAAHSWLAREGPQYGLSPSSVLVDYDAQTSMFGQMESFHTASGTEKAQRIMASLLENSLVSMTRRAKQLERLTADLEQQRLRRIPKPPTFKNPFARRDENTDSAGQDGSKPVFVNPFARKQPQADEGTQDAQKLSKGGFSMAFGRKQSTESDGESNDDGMPKASSFKLPFVRTQTQKEVTTETLVEDASGLDASTSATEKTEGPAESRQAKMNPFKGLGASISIKPKDSADDENKAMEDTKPKVNPFKGLGAALNGTMKARDSNFKADADPSDGNEKPVNNPFKSMSGRRNPPTKPATVSDGNRNPFARFGSRQHQQQLSVGVGGLAGLNQFRKKTMARMRTSQQQQQGEDEHEDESADEAITFATPDDDDNLELHEGTISFDVQQV